MGRAFTDYLACSVICFIQVCGRLEDPEGWGGERQANAQRGGAIIMCNIGDTESACVIACVVEGRERPPVEGGVAVGYKLDVIARYADTS